jgi:hypothetical protein
MHPRLMKHLAIAFVGGSAVLLACVVHNDTTSPVQPEPVPADTTPPTRFVVDSGLVTFSGDGATTVPGIGSAGATTPDARELPDSGPDVATPDLGALGSSCDVFAQNCGTGYGCYPRQDGTAICDIAGTLFGGSQCIGDSPDSRCRPGMTCANNICSGLCHYGQASVTECGDSIGSTCARFGPQGSTVGVCTPI